jgi:hypothetical protein
MYQTLPSVYSGKRLLSLPPDAEGNPPYYSVSNKAPHALLLSKQTTLSKRCILGNEEALACTDARRVYAVLDFLVTFFIKKKGKNENYL